MGRVAKQVSHTTTKYYWYPGSGKEWFRAAVAVGAGLVVFGVVLLLIRDLLVAATVGSSVITAITGANLGRRDARGLVGFPEVVDKGRRRDAVGHTGRAAWRAMVHGLGGAGAAVLILNLPHDGFVHGWLLPVVPAVVGALAHQAGMLYEQAGTTVTAAEAKNGAVFER